MTDNPYMGVMPNMSGMQIPQFHLKAEEVEKIVLVAKDNGITFSKDEYLYICNLVFGRVPDPYADNIAKILLSMSGAASQKNDDLKNDNPKKETVKDAEVDKDERLERI